MTTETPTPSPRVCTAAEQEPQPFDEHAWYEASFTLNQHGVQVWRVGGGDVPRCCIECKHCEPPERGDYGEPYSGPWCALNVWFPVRKGVCKWQNK